MMDFKNLEVVLLENQFSDVDDDLTRSKHVGFSLIVEDEKLIIAACLTTETKIYIVKPDIESHKTFLNNQFSRKHVDFYIVDGIWAALHLKKIGVYVKGNIDLTSFDVQIALRKSLLNNPKPLVRCSSSYIKDFLKLKNLNYEELVHKWLGSITIIELSVDEMRKLKVHSLDISIKTAIRNYAGPVRTLAITMVESFQGMLDKASKDIYSLASLASDNLREEYDRMNDNKYKTLCVILNQRQHHTQEF